MNEKHPNKLVAAVPHKPAIGKLPIAVPHKPAVGKAPIVAPHKPAVGKAPIAVPHKPAVGKLPIAVPHKPAVGKLPIAVPHKPAVGKAPIAVPHKPAVGKAPIAVLHKPVAAKPNPVKGVAGAEFHDFKNGIMMNDGRGNLDDRNDWLETIPTKLGNHIGAYCLTVPYKEWVYNFQSDCTMDPDFMSWLFDVFVPREEDRGRIYKNYLNELVQPGLTRREMLNAIKYERVVYLTENQRKEKIISINGKGLLLDRSGRLYHTGTEATTHSGSGWVIFVMDKNHIIYASSNISEVFNHSSFLRGNYVASAGEIKVNNGQLVAITCKSGHYRPKKENMKYFLDSLQRRGVNLRGVGVQMGWYDTRLNNLGKRVPLLYDAAEILNGRNVIFYGVI